MGIYTKKGDKGQTSLFDGQRVKKYSERVSAYGTLDECNAHISLAAKLVKKSQNNYYLEKIQHQLFYLSAEVATIKQETLTAKSRLVTTEEIRELEKVIDDYTTDLPPVNSFILPGQSLAGAQLHVARTVSRRAERLIVALAEETAIRPEVLQYLNRLSDVLYILARSEDHEAFQEKVIAKVIAVYQEQVASLEKVTNKPGDLTYDCLINMQTAVFKEAQRLAVPVTFSVVDRSGVLIYSYRMPKSLLVSVELATKKAYSATAMALPTAAIGKLVREDGELYQLETALDGKIVSFGGGLPLYSGSRIVGGIGVSGGTVAEDEQIVAAARKSFQQGGHLDV